ncbi:Subtilisin-like protease CPC735_013710 [Rhizoctonia solani]|uniref:Subtilisin-like protease CPC735_013710 n=1 Tax=Rhizoctonia solani TaxID=456999 RepID=A0A0K6FZX2_9AGAM|nr:Subtilisin-like protease CPC735_013710 [Rhizoctonia solani]
MIITRLFALALLASSGSGLALPFTPFTGFEPTSQSFIVKLKPGHSCQSHFSRIKGSLGKVESGRATHFDSRIFNGYAIQLDDQATIKSLSLLDSVEYIEPDTVFSVASLMTQTDAPWGLQAITRSIAFPISNESSLALNYKYEYDTSAGQGVDIYILDSGVYSNHTDFANRVEHSPVFARYTTTGDVFGHGTHVAGIAAGTRFGVAKQARIIDVKVITDTGRGFASDIIAGLSWAVAHANSTGRPSVFNLSLGGGTSSALDDAVMGVVNAGIHTVVAAGNAAADINTTDWSPARVPGVIAVGNVDLNGVRSKTSNYGSPVALFAPGVNITSAGINGPTSSRVDSGTSMAAPHVAGLVAYLTGLEGLRTPPEMKTRVQALARADILSDIPNGTVNLMSQNTL